MTKQILQNLFLTFILSLLLTGIFYSIWFSSKHIGFEEVRTMAILFAVSDFFQNLILAIASFPFLFLTKDTYYNNVQARIFFYFFGPVLLTMIFVFFIGNSSEDKISFLLPSLSFLSIHSYFYFRLTQFKKAKAQC